MKTIMISIHPEHCHNIFVGYKKIEIRKSICKPPFKALVYCTKSMTHLYRYDKCIDENEQLFTVDYNKHSLMISNEFNGKVIGEFICNEVEQLQYQTTIPCIKINENDEIEISGNTAVEPFYNGKVRTIKESCLTQEQLLAYGQGKTLYGLHITAPKLYDKPKELGEFRKPCGDCIGKCTGEQYDRCPWQTITKPPQSYMRIQDTKEERK